MPPQFTFTEHLHLYSSVKITCVDGASATPHPDLHPDRPALVHHHWHLHPDTGGVALKKSFISLRILSSGGQTYQRFLPLLPPLPSCHLPSLSSLLPPLFPQEPCRSASQALLLATIQVQSLHEVAKFHICAKHAYIIYLSWTLHVKERKTIR